ncbi:MAG: extracellular solute-binding protein [Oscillospiraceae bacterium]|jgi:ABC-type glycerol-3-phosphate transport system substrate-binding protein|nr:extracellular solute-binding protein [Oscillospiraceae bacterium]
MKTRKILAIILCCAVALTLFAGCGNKNNADPGSAGGSGNGSPISGGAFSNVYKETEIPINLGSSMNTVITAAGDRLYYNKMAFDYTTFAVTSSSISSVNYEGGDEQTVWTAPEGDLDEDPKITKTMMLTSFSIDDAGNIWLLAAYTVDDQTDPQYAQQLYTTVLVKVLPSGETQFEVDLTALDNSMYPQNVILDAAGNAYLYSGQNVYVIDGATGGLAFKLTESQGSFISGAAKASDGNVVYVVGGGQGGQNGGSLIKTINYGAKSADGGKSYTGTKIGGGGGGFGFGGTTLAPGFGDYAFIYASGDNIYGLRLDTMQEEVIVSYINSDIETATISAFYPLPNRTFFVRKGGAAGGFGGASTFAILSENTDAKAGEKEVITFGVIFMDADTKAAILNFNKTSTTTRIDIRDYSQYNTASDGGAGITQLDLDILAGKGPDILSLQALQASKYIAKGALEDLTPYLENDSNVNRSDLFENVLQASSYEGKLYHIFPFFSVQTAVGKESTFGDKTAITTAELDSVWKKYPDATVMSNGFMAMSASDFLNSAANNVVNTYIDWSTGKCTFNSQEFIDFLTFVKRLPTEVTPPDFFDPTFQQTNQTQFPENRTLLLQSTISAIRDIRSVNEQFQEMVSYVGFPTTGDSGNAIMPQSNLSISSASVHKDAAWGFISSLIREDVKLSTGGGGFGFGGGNAVLSINRNRFLRELTTEQTPFENRDFSKGISMFGQTFYNYDEYKAIVDGAIGSPYEFNEANYLLSAEEAAKIQSAIESAHTIYGANTQVLSIINEEASAVFAGAKSPEDAANVIQSRVTLYVNESN